MRPADGNPFQVEVGNTATIGRSRENTISLHNNPHVSRQQRDLRELTRHRSSLAGKRAQAANELQKALESANIKLQSVVSDITGVSSTEMLEELVAGKSDPKELAQLATRRLRAKIPQLEKALGPVHEFLIKMKAETMQRAAKKVFASLS